MGLINSSKIDNALYGHKGDLKQSFRNNAAPDWLEPDSPGMGGKTEIRPQKESAQSFYRKWCAVWDQRDRRGGILQYSFGKRTPDSIRHSITEYCDSSNHQRNLNRLVPGEWFNGVFLVVHVGNRGGISDMYVEAEYVD